MSASLGLMGPHYSYTIARSEIEARGLTGAGT